MAIVRPKSSPDVATTARAEIASDLCKGCCLCVIACPRGVLVRSERLNKRGYYVVEYVGKGCTGCGLCFYNCPEPGALTIYRRSKAR